MVENFVMRVGDKEDKGKKMLRGLRNRRPRPAGQQCGLYVYLGYFEFQPIDSWPPRSICSGDCGEAFPSVPS